MPSLAISLALTQQYTPLQLECNHFPTIAGALFEYVSKITDKLESAIATKASAVLTILEETSVNIEIIEAHSQDKPILSHLIELYFYDFSEFMGWDVGNDGRFGDNELKGCWTEPWRHPFLVKVDGSLAGFVIADGRSYLSGDEHTMDMGEFFILRKYRRQGIGYRVASFIFDLFPSKWEVRQLGLNVDAQTFWRKVINRYTNNQFYEISWNKERSSGVAQLFNNTDCTRTS